MEYNSLVSPAFTNDFTDEGCLRHLSLYATLREDDLKGIIGNLNISSSKIHEKKASPRYQSLQDLFPNIPPRQGHLADRQSVPAIAEEENSCSSSESLVENVSGATQVVCCGEDVNDLPVEYTVENIQSHEFPVIGFYVDRRVCPGFRYRIRYAASQRDALDDQGRVLLSIGMGYGKRLTFRGDQLNNNDCYFWSDSHQEGFAFRLQVLQKGDTFVLYDDQALPIGEVQVVNAESPQVEESMETTNSQVKKLVRVRFECLITYHNRFHGSLVEINNQDVEIVEGLAEVVKSKKEKEANVQCIKNVFVPRVGNCTLWRE